MNLPMWRPSGTGSLRVVGLLLLAVGLVLLATDRVGAQQEPSVLRVEIHDEIDLGLAPFLDRALAEAEADGVDTVLLDIDTPGGRLDAVLQMRDALLSTPVPTVAFVDATAFSAGALVALASEQILMAPGAVIGAATPVDAGTGAPTDEKVVSAVRSTFRATAEERGRDPRLAEAMVDPAIEVEGVVGRGELLTLTASEALELGLADGVVADREEVLAAAGLEGATVVEASPGPAERLVRFLTNPVLVSLLLTAGMWLLIGDLLSGGVGLASLIGALLLAVFFWGHLLAGLAGWEDVALVAAGLLLILIELLIVPGFGVPGLLGLAALLGGSFLAMINRDLDFVGPAQMLRAGTVVAVAFAAIVVGLIAMLTYLARAGGPPGLVLRSRLGGAPPVTERSTAGWLGWFGAAGGVLASEPGDGPRRDHPHEEATGRRPAAGTRLSPGTPGVALTDLRPSGMADIGGERVDVVTAGEYLTAGDELEIVRDEGYRRIVRRSAT